MAQQQRGPGSGPWPPPPEPIRPPAAKRSEEAARAAQHVLDLETDLAQSRAEVANLQNLLQLAEERNIQLTGDLAACKIDRDYYQKRTTEIMTKLTISATIILDAMKEPPERQDSEQRARVAEAAEAALSMTHEPPETDR